ncbi:MAG: YnfA family protein [Methylophilaceae bacterium]|jgi:small multidrug resistance family-3 protein|nr:YnfA family protein [Methylophilaceae bacterium]
MQTFGILVVAAVMEIAGCFSFWAWSRLNQSIFFIVPGMLSLAIFAYLLTLIDVDYAGRSFAGYGGIYIVSSLVWMWAIEKQTPDVYDFIGASFCIFGALIILYGHKIF